MSLAGYTVKSHHIQPAAYRAHPTAYPAISPHFKACRAEPPAHHLTKYMLEDKFGGVDDETVEAVNLPSIETIVKQIAGFLPTKPGRKSKAIEGNPGPAASLNTHYRYRLNFINILMVAKVANLLDLLVTQDHHNTELVGVHGATRIPKQQWWPLLVGYP